MSKSENISFRQWWQVIRMINMHGVKILEIKMIGAGIVFIAFALIVIVGYALGPYLTLISPNDGTQLILAAHISLVMLIFGAVSMIYSILRYKE